MQMISRQLMILRQLIGQLIEFDITTYGEIYGCTSQHCGDKWGVGVVMWVARNT